jgi:hypothetical protein
VSRRVIKACLGCKRSRQLAAGITPSARMRCEHWASAFSLGCSMPPDGIAASLEPLRVRAPMPCPMDLKARWMGRSVSRSTETRRHDQAVRSLSPRP